MFKLSNYITGITRPLFKNKGLLFAQLLDNWEKIFGDNISQYTAPKKITKGYKDIVSLTIEVNDSSIASQIPYLEKLILERIEAVFGYKAITQIKIIQNIKYKSNDSSIDIKKIYSKKQSDLFISSKENISEDKKLEDLLFELKSLIKGETNG